MKDVKIILSCLLKDFDSDDSLEGFIYAIRHLINLIDSHECLQRSIAELSKMKIQDQKHFENIALAVIKDVHQATSDLRKKIDCFPRLKEAINPTFFADIKNKVKLTEYPIEERPLLLIDPFLKLLRAVLDCGETENLITPYASIASNNDSQFIREITFSNNIRTFCRDAEHFRGRRDMALWNIWDNIIIFHEWTQNGLPNPAFKEKVGNFSGKNQIKYAFKAICRYLLTSLLAVEDDASDSVSSINGNLPTMLSKQKPETFIITALELFIHPFDCQIWIILHHTDREYVPYFVVTCRDESRAYKFAMDLLELPKGAVLDDEDLPAKRNDIGIKGLLKNIFFTNSNVFNGRYVKIDELTFKISIDKLFDVLPKNEGHTIPPFPINAYIEYRKITA